MTVKIRPFRYGNINVKKCPKCGGDVVKIRPFRYGNEKAERIREKAYNELKSDRFGMEIS